MSRLDHLPPDQRAALQLLLRARKSHAEVAQTLGIAPEALHDRAHAALAALVPTLARPLDAGLREQIGEYLLGQQSAEQADSTKIQLAASDPAREWARALAAQLVHLAAAPLPTIPDPDAGRPAAPAPATPEPDTDRPPAPAAAPAERRPAPSPPPRPATTRAATAGSRRAGAALLAVILVAAVVAIVLVSTSGSKGPSGTPPAQQAASREGAGGGHRAKSKSTANGGSESTDGSTSPAKPKIDNEIALTAPESSSHAHGVALVATEKGKHALLLAAEGLAKPEGFFYVVWLTSSSGKAEPLAKATKVNSKGGLVGVDLLPSNAGEFDRIELTRETSEHPKSPSTPVLSGEFSLH